MKKHLSRSVPVAFKNVLISLIERDTSTHVCLTIFTLLLFSFSLFLKSHVCILGNFSLNFCRSSLFYFCAPLLLTQIEFQMWHGLEGNQKRKKRFVNTSVNTCKQPSTHSFQFYLLSVSLLKTRIRYL